MQWINMTFSACEHILTYYFLMSSDEQDDINDWIFARKHSDKFDNLQVMARAKTIMHKSEN